MDICKLINTPFSKEDAISVTIWYQTELSSQFWPGRRLGDSIFNSFGGLEILLKKCHPSIQYYSINLKRFWINYTFCMRRSIHILLVIRLSSNILLFIVPKESSRRRSKNSFLVAFFFWHGKAILLLKLEVVWVTKPE